MQTVAPSREELLTLVDAYHRERETHRRAAPGTHARAAAAGRMRELDTAFERRVRAWAVDERLRQAWRDTFHRSSPVPMRPAAVPRVLFRGRSEAGSEVQACTGRGRDIDIRVDGQVVRRVEALNIERRDGRTFLRLDPLPPFEEAFGAPPEAIRALRTWVNDPSGEPPWRYALDLAADGLLDRHFELTPRGRRAVEVRQPAMV